MNRCVYFVEHLLADLYDAACAMLDGTYWQTYRDAQIHYCGSDDNLGGWAGGEGDGS